MAKNNIQRRVYVLVLLIFLLISLLTVSSVSAAKGDWEEKYLSAHTRSGSPVKMLTGILFFAIMGLLIYGVGSRMTGGEMPILVGFLAVVGGMFFTLALKAQSADESIFSLTKAGNVAKAILIVGAFILGIWAIKKIAPTGEGGKAKGIINQIKGIFTTGGSIFWVLKTIFFFMLFIGFWKHGGQKILAWTVDYPLLNKIMSFLNEKIFGWFVERSEAFWQFIFDLFDSLSK
ncbi:hypothetical protein ACFL0W_03815 [Nanoarchaeota archaeon]